MSPFQYPWQSVYAAALTELDAGQLAGRVQEAQSILQKRVAELERTSDSAAEREAIQDALFMLEVLTKR